MRNALSLIILVVTANGGPPIPFMNKLPIVGERFVVARNLRDLSGVCMVSPGQMDRCVKAMIGGVEFTIAYRARSRKPSVVTYMHTADPNFRSPSAQRVGDIVEVRYSEIVRAPGFEIYAGSPVGGWTTVVGFNGKVEASPSRGEVELDDLHASDGPLRLRITGFSAR